MSTCENRATPIQVAAARYGLFSGTAGLVMRVGALLRRYVEHRRRRLGANQLTALDEHALKDIGLTSADVERIAAARLEMGGSAAFDGRSRRDPVESLLLRR